MFTQLKLTLISSLILFGIIGFLQMRYHSVKSELDVARQQIITLSSELNDQNAAIAEWQAKAKSAAERATTAENNAQKKIIVSQNEAQHILNQKVSPDCSSAVQWGTKEAKRLATQW